MTEWLQIYISNYLSTYIDDRYVLISTTGHYPRTDCWLPRVSGLDGRRPRMGCIFTILPGRSFPLTPPDHPHGRHIHSSRPTAWLYAILPTEFSSKWLPDSARIKRSEGGGGARSSEFQGSLWLAEDGFLIICIGTIHVCTQIIRTSSISLLPPDLRLNFVAMRFELGDFMLSSMTQRGPKNYPVLNLFIYFISNVKYVFHPRALGPQSWSSSLPFIAQLWADLGSS